MPPDMDRELGPLMHSAPDTAHWVVAYDIADPRRLRRVAKTLEQAGQRIQKSVFNVADRRERLAALACELSAAINHDEDQILLHPCCAICRHGTLWQGRPPGPEHEPFWIV